MMPQKKSNSLRDLFHRFSRVTAEAVGSMWAFMIACGSLIIWGALGPVFDFADTWQLFVNTGTTIITFLMVFLIQSTQNRDSKAIHLKLDELIRVIREARNNLIDLEDLPEAEMNELASQFAGIHKKAHDEASGLSRAPQKKKASAHRGRGSQNKK